MAKKLKCSIIGYKKVIGSWMRGAIGAARWRRRYAILKLRIPAGTLRVKRKVGEGLCKQRAEKAIVLAYRYGRRQGWQIYRGPIFYSMHDHTFSYQVGKTVRPLFKFDKTVKECGSGIHYFLTEQEAWDY